jgi:glycerophosphoryl diester phosphodiesterase
LTSAACDVIRRTRTSAPIIIKSFYLPALAEVRRLLPTVETAALFAPQLSFLTRSRRIVDLARGVEAQHISLHTYIARRRLTRLARKSNMQVTVWTADHPRWLRRCGQRGISALITNDPAKMLSKRRTGRPAT